MSDLVSSVKSVITVSEMAELCRLSRSRFYDLIEEGVFPEPVRHPAKKRPMYDRSLQEKCLEIRETGIGMSGQPVLFNRKPRKPGPAKVARKASSPNKQPDHAQMLEALKGLGMVTTAQAVTDALAALVPNGQAGLDQGDLIRKVFLHLQTKKK